MLKVALLLCNFRQTPVISSSLSNYNLKLKNMFNKILAICSSACMAYFVYLLCEAKLSIGIASAFFFLSVFVLNNYFITDDKLNNNE